MSHQVLGYSCFWRTWYALFSRIERSRDTLHLLQGHKILLQTGDFSGIYSLYSHIFHSLCSEIPKHLGECKEILIWDKTRTRGQKDRKLKGCALFQARWLHCSFCRKPRLLDDILLPSLNNFCKWPTSPLVLYRLQLFSSLSYEEIPKERVDFPFFFFFSLSIFFNEKECWSSDFLQRLITYRMRRVLGVLWVIQ